MRSPLRDLALGAVMGFLPCMIVLWALGLSALTGSALHGAAIMLILVALTTPVLLGVTLLPRVLRRPSCGSPTLCPRCCSRSPAFGCS